MEASTADVVVDGDGDLGERLVIKVVQASYTTKETRAFLLGRGAGPITMSPDQLLGLSVGAEGRKGG